MATNTQSSGWIGPAIAAGASLVSTGANMFQAGKLNKRGENFARWMYAKQRADALADWEMQNEYNSPAAQMQRFKDAGLNPNLVYGQGSPGEAGSVRSSSVSQPRYQAANLGGLGSVVMDALAAKQMRANIQRTEAETTRIQETTRTGRFKNDLNDAIGLDRMLRAESSRLESQDQKYINERYKAEAEFDALFRNEDGKLTTAGDPSNMMSKIIKAGFQTTFQKLSNLQKDGKIKEAIRVVKDFEASLAKQGIPPNSPWYVKALEKLIEKLDISLF